LVARVKAVLRRAQGEREVADVIDAGGLHIDAASREATLDGRPLTLRGTEHVRVGGEEAVVHQ